MKILKNYRFNPANISQGIYAKFSIVRMGRNVQLLSVSARTFKNETQLNEEFIISVLEEECEIADGEAYKFFLVPVWQNEKKYKYNMLTEDYTFLNSIQLENEAYNVFYKKIIN